MSLVLLDDVSQDLQGLVRICALESIVAGLRRRQGQFAAGRKAVQRLLPAIATILIASETTPAQQATQPYPFAIGNYWIYQGRLTEPATYDQGRWLPPKSQERTWRSEITQVVYRRHGIEAGTSLLSSVSAAVFDNFPPLHPLASSADRFPGILLRVNKKLYEILDGPTPISRILLRVQDSNDSLFDLLRDLTPILDLPLSPGKHWGLPFFSWAVTRREKNQLIGVRGADATLNREGFTLETSDNTGTTTFTFVPGVGITHVSSASLFPRGDSNHWESDARLVEVHLNQTRAAAAR